jgi:murein DD-endopeptidase MepM/ murein hydrolase activator NlpD
MSEFRVTRQTPVRRLASVLGAQVLIVTLALSHSQTVLGDTCIPGGDDVEGSAERAGPTGATGNSAERESAQLLPAARLIIPVMGFMRVSLRDSFYECRGERRHEGIDIAAALRTPVIAAGDGTVAKLFNSVAGGYTIYQFDPDATFVYYYAHLDAYAPGLREGATLKRGDLLGYVGVTGNAAADAPHLHFEILRLEADKKWWEGEAVNPYPFLNDAER